MDGSKVHTVVAHVGSQVVVEYHWWLGIRSTVSGGSDRLDIRSFVSVDEGEEVRGAETEKTRCVRCLGSFWFAARRLCAQGSSTMLCLLSKLSRRPRRRRCRQSPMMTSTHTQTEAGWVGTRQKGCWCGVPSAAVSAPLGSDRS